MWPQRRTRTFRSVVLRALAPRLVAFGGCAACLVLGQAMADPGGGGTRIEIIEHAIQAPGWTLADTASYPGCVPSALWPEGTPAPTVVVEVAASGDHRKVGFDRAWVRNHNSAADDDLWVLGVCP
jgi:hypothetical protein